MNIAQKLQTIAENEQKVYEAGQKSMVDESKIIEKTASGIGIVALNDVSEIPHDVKVTAPNAEVIKVCGNNLVKPTTYKVDYDNSTIDGDVITSDFKNGAIYFNAGKKGVWRAGTYSVTIVPVSSSFYGAFLIYSASDNTTLLDVIYIDKIIAPWQYTFTAKEDFVFCIGGYNGTDSAGYKETSYKVQLEVGNATEYERYIESIEYTPDVDGVVVVKSISPKMTILADGDIAVEYHKSYGMQTAYNRFWYGVQDGGKRTNYNRAFTSWNLAEFYPAYNIKPIGDATQLFYNTVGGEFDLVTRLKECNVELDMSEVTNFAYTFAATVITHLPLIDMRKGTILTSAFRSGANATSIKIIDGIILKDDGSQVLTDMFAYASNLENLTIEGTIGQNGFNVQWSTKLTHDSIVSIINALSETTAGLSVTLSLAAVNKAFETSDGANDGSSSAEFTNLVQTKSNWTISLS